LNTVVLFGISKNSLKIPWFDYQPFPWHHAWKALSSSEYLFASLSFNKTDVELGFKIFIGTKK
jgi:hypothetical protein